MRLLLDANVWIALLDDAHIHSAAANALLDRPDLHIATCPMVGNAVIHVLNLPAYARIGPFGLARARDQMARACEELDHEFWPDDISLREANRVDFNRVRGHNQITDLYLLALVVKHGGSLATFDQGIALSAVTGARPQHLTLL